jgi:hypothetical protein
MEDSAKKTCSFCCEPINIGAKKCPHCQSWVQGPSRWLTGWAGAIIYFALASGFMLYFLSPLQRRSANFLDHREQVTIVAVKMQPDSDREGAHVTFLGQIRNDSPVKWEHPYFEVQCFDKAGTLVDTYATYDSQIVLVPNTEHAFKIGFNARGNPSTYATQKVFLRDARDANRWW